MDKYSFYKCYLKLFHKFFNKIRWTRGGGQISQFLQSCQIFYLNFWILPFKNLNWYWLIFFFLLLTSVNKERPAAKVLNQCVWTPSIYKAHGKK